ncbi:nicotinate-nucleotide--dimethylbenzimidazole phosphoribosyltransferase [Clostridium tunisiense]|uniref:nicotinate-nucleotide--dimethylbenzimidazole phosphoribosyltransferase n=1 Tax=Clostridium tunisiense TaxID=219748 RepID=UPI0002FDF629|nr:nicotinate-nucleotide--dimethylbenzimidazole phosphoribosyltransferase [Clostridium tunisiense]
MERYSTVIREIKELDKGAMEAAATRLDNLIKPIGSLGRLEDIAIQLSGITGNLHNEVSKGCNVIMCADNGIWDEGISTCPQDLTQSQTLNFTRGLCGINAVCSTSNMDIRVVDIGIKGDINHPQVINKKIRYGTWNMCKGRAMTEEEAIKAIEAGIEVVGDLVKEGYQIIGTGEMGICNTSTSSAIIMALTGCSSEEAVGMGAGLTEEGFEKKKRAIEKALELNKPSKENPIDVLAKVGGFDIAGLVGCFLGAAYYRVPIIVDGIISSAAALVAWKINPLVKDYMIPSHSAVEVGQKIVMKNLGLEPILNLNMRLGEGTGCPLVHNIVIAATRVMNNMATFQEAAIASEHFVDIRKK